MRTQRLLDQLGAKLASGAVLSGTLGPDTPILQLPRSATPPEARSARSRLSSGAERAAAAP